MQGIFLKARWEKLVMLNYVVDPRELLPFVPAGTELDLWEGKCYVSVVGFLFLKTRVLGLPVPFHTHFEELNLRFYVRRWDGKEWRRGVAFIKEVVPKPAIAWVARVVYNENYVAMPMRHSLSQGIDMQHVSYEWKPDGIWDSISVKASNKPEPMRPGSEEEFIAEHYWGYAAQKDGGTVEYQVEHPRWNIFPVLKVGLSIRPHATYGTDLGMRLLAGMPRSVFLAEGSEVIVRKGVRLDL